MVNWGWVVEKLQGVSLGAVGYMLRDCAESMDDGR